MEEFNNGLEFIRKLISWLHYSLVIWGVVSIILIATHPEALRAAITISAMGGSDLTPYDSTKDIEAHADDLHEMQRQAKQIDNEMRTHKH